MFYMPFHFILFWGHLGAVAGYASECLFHKYAKAEKIHAPFLLINISMQIKPSPDCFLPGYNSVILQSEIQQQSGCSACLWVITQDWLGWFCWVWIVSTVHRPNNVFINCCKKMRKLLLLLYGILILLSCSRHAVNKAYEGRDFWEVLDWKTTNPPPNLSSRTINTNPGCILAPSQRNSFGV